VPEGSDDEATDDDMSSGSDVNPKTINARTLPNGSTNPAARNVIDLTTAQSGRQTRQVIDLSSPCGSPIRIADDDEEEESNGAPQTFAAQPSFEVEEPLVPENVNDRADQELRDDYDTDQEYGDGLSDLDSRADKDSDIDYPDDGSDSMADEYGFDDDGSDEDVDSEDDVNAMDDMDSMDPEDNYPSDDYGLDSPGEDAFLLSLLSCHDNR
jgi:hypothetical protein